MTAVAVLHTTQLPQYPGLPDLDVVAHAVPPVIAYFVRCVGLFLQSSAVPDGPVVRTWVCALLDLAGTALVSLNLRPFLLSEFKCGNHVELLEFVMGLECLHLRTRRIVPVLIDMKISYIRLRWAFRRLLRHRIRNKGAGGAWRHTGGAWSWKPLPARPLSPIPGTNWGPGFDAGQSFYGPARGLDAGVPLGTVLPPLGGKGAGEAVALEAQVGVHPPGGIHLGEGGVYDPGQEV